MWNEKNLRPRFFISLLVCFLTIKVEATQIRNTIQFGWGASNEGIGVNGKYMHKFGPIYLGGEFKFEEEFEIFGTSNIKEGATSFRIPLGIVRVGDHHFVGVESGIGLSKFTRHGRLIKTDCQGFFSCDSEYEAIHKYGIGISPEANTGLILKHFGIGISGGYEINSYRSSPYLHLKFWIGY